MHFGYTQCKQRGFVQPLLIILVLITLVSITVLGLYFYLNSSSSSNSSKNPFLQITPVAKNVISNIQSYSNEEFEFKYSKDMKAQEDTEEAFNQRGGGDFRKNFNGYVQYEPPKFLGAVAVLDKTGSFDNNPFTVWVFDNPNDITIDGWFDKYWYYPFLWGVFDYVSKGHVTLDKEATVSGVVARYKVVSYQPGSPKYVYLPKDKKMYLFRIIGEAGDKILQTFKFLP